MANPLQQFSRKCCTRQHLTIEEWGLLEDCTRLTCGGKNTFLLDGRKAAERFCQTGKNTVYRIVKLLVDKGWLVRISGGTRNRTSGMYDPTVYRILTHSEWLNGANRTCPDLRTGPVPDSGQAPVPKTGQAPVPISMTTSPVWPLPPVPDSGHSTVIPSVKTYGTTPLCPATAKKSLNQEQEKQSDSDGVNPSSPDSGTGLHSVHNIPAYAEYDYRERCWGCRRDIGRGLTNPEIAEIKRLNRENVKPQSIQ